MTVTTNPAPAEPARTPRLPFAERERQIVEGAIKFFSETGFAGQTRELSKRLGITQPLLYRYFDSKQALIERVYQTVFEARWNPAWVPLLQDRSVPLRERVLAFYREYSEATYQPEWIRIYLHAGLSDPTLNRRYLQHVRRELIPAWCRELRQYCGLPDSDVPVAEQELEFVWNLHGGIFYMALRSHVYRIRSNVDFMTQVGFAVDNFLAGALTTYPRLVAEFSPLAMTTSAHRKRSARRPSSSTA